MGRLTNTAEAAYPLRMVGLPQSLGLVSEYDDLRAIARARMAELQISFETLDAVSGVCAGYSAKILGPNACKRFGPVSLPAILGALGLKLLVIEDLDQLDRVRSRLVRRNESHVRHRPPTHDGKRA